MCPELVTRADKGFCEKHRKAYSQAVDRNRGTATERGYDSRWGKFRVSYLRRHPICTCGCGGAAQEIHHIEPVKGPDDPLFYEESNLLALTKSCHSAVTMKALRERREA
jgi:5-methylcytosine-specific restriction protein A